MVELEPIRLSLEGDNVTLHAVPPSHGMRALLRKHHFRYWPGAQQWDLHPAWPPAIKQASIDGLVADLRRVGFALVIDDRRQPAETLGRHDTMADLREFYPAGQGWRFETAHYNYVTAVAATAHVSGMAVQAYSVGGGNVVTDAAARTGLRVTARTGGIELADGREVEWDEAVGWRDSATSRPLPISQVADPVTVVEAVAALPVPAAPVMGRDPSQLDLVFEQALAAYRDHPATAAMLAAALRVPSETQFEFWPAQAAAIRQWHPAEPGPARWQTTALMPTQHAQRVSAAWPAAAGRRASPTSYPAPAVSAVEGLRQAKLRDARTSQGRDPAQR